jgi:hypothetical protein
MMAFVVKLDINHMMLRVFTIGLNRKDLNLNKVKIISIREELRKGLMTTK